MIEETLASLIGWSTDRKDRFYGVVTGKVIKILGDEMELGRVQVELPFLDSSDPSPWARVAVPMAGSSSGTYLIPNVGDEVLVAFEQGDVNAPYVLGCLWNTKAPPPVPSPAEQVWLIKTPAGNTIRIAEKPAAITIETANGQKIEMGSEKIRITTGDSAVELTSSGVTVSGGTISLQGKQAIEITAPNVTVKSDSVMTVQSSGVCNITGATVKIN